MLQGANLSDAVLSEIKGAGLKIDDKTVLTRVLFSDADISDIDFCGIDLSGCVFDYGFIHNCNLSNSMTGDTSFKVLLLISHLFFLSFFVCYFCYVVFTIPL